jgi:syringate O-demethylase
MTQSLASVIGAQANLVDFLRNQQVGPNVYPGVPAEYSNWRAEQWAWGHTAVLYNQSYHMVDLAVRGPDAFKMLEHLGINSFKNFQPDRAKQFVPVTPDGYVIGDVILFYLDENEFNLVGRAPTIEWVEYHAASGNWNVTVERDERWAMRNDGKRNSYRFQIQGPNAMKIIEKATGKTPPELKFFHMTRMTIGGKDVRALRHGMAGQPGFELFGPWEDYGAVHAALVEAGKEFGMALVGGRAYSSNTLESGWIPPRCRRSTPARRWLPTANGSRPIPMKPSARSAAAMFPKPSKVITRRRGIWVTARSSSSTTTSSAAPRWKRCTPPATTAPR